MKKNEKKKVAVTWIFAILSIAAIAGLVVFAFLSAGLKGVASDFTPEGPVLSAVVGGLTFQFIQGFAFPGSLLPLAAAVAVYLGGFLFLIGLIVIIAKKSPRFLILPFVVLLAFVAAAYGFIVYENAVPAAERTFANVNHTIPVILVPALVVLAIVCCVFQFAFPKNLKKEAAEEIAEPKAEEPAPVAEEAPIEEAKPEEKPAPEEEKPEEKPVESGYQYEPAPVAAAPAEEAKPDEKPAPAPEKKPAPAAKKPAQRKVLVVKKNQAAAAPAPKAAKAATFNGGARVYHISKHPSGQWQIKLATSDKVIKILPTQAEAIAYAKGLVESRGGSVRVHSVKGKIRKE